jgi:GNAT superfamily N-acetyltransferase
VPDPLPIHIGTLHEKELPEAHRIMRLAFGTFLGLPDPLAFLGDRNFIAPRFHAMNTRVIAARLENRLMGVSVATRWGSFAFLGPVAVLPEFWNRGVAQRLIRPAIRAFEKWEARQSGLFTFPASSGHIALYQKFGFWPRFLTAIMGRAPEPDPALGPPTLLTQLPSAQQEAILDNCSRLAGRIEKGLDLTAEIRALLAQKSGDVVLTHTNDVLDGFALCVTGASSEGGSKTCYVKFAAVRPGSTADTRFTRLLQAIDAFAAPRALAIEAGVNLACEPAFRAMQAHGFRLERQGVCMVSPNAPGFCRPDAWVIADLR